MGLCVVFRNASVPSRVLCTYQVFDSAHVVWATLPLGRHQHPPAVLRIPAARGGHKTGTAVRHAGGHG